MMTAKCASLLAVCAIGGYATSIPIRVEALHLRSGEQREWRSFPPSASGPSTTLAFQASVNASEFALVFRQHDVKAVWNVSINDRKLGTLIQDERNMLHILPVPAGVLRAGENQLRIASQPASFSDDISVRDLRIEDVSVRELQRQATVDVAVTSETGAMPVRVTIVDSEGFLVPVGPLRNGAYEAVRTGVVYTADGSTSIGLPAGEYRIYASRGFEYSAPSARVKLAKGQRRSVALKIRREVEMPFYAGGDTHVHTLELSGHGDASVDERILTAAGEGLNWIVATEHNRFSDYSAAIAKRGFDRWVTAIPGTEVTTPIGHFNIFPVRAGTTYPDFRETNWSKLMNSLKATEGVQVVVQNHPRDVHSGYRPFDPANHVSKIGENTNGRPVLANAMEVVNSGAMASDPLQLVRDWMGLLSRGLSVAAIGASDTHTVDFVPIGQARTYTQNGAELVADQLAAGRSLVSYGLAVELQQNGPLIGTNVPIEVTVWGPSWSEARDVTVYSNGVPVWTKKIKGNRKGGRKLSAKVQVPASGNDTALVAVTTGPGVLQPFWEVRKPYQPTSDEWTPMILGVSSAVWVDVDGNGRRDAPLDYARELVKKHAGNSAALETALAAYDEAVREHARRLLQ